MSGQNNGEIIRVVVAGVGAVTAQGASADALWEGVKAGNVAIRKVERVPMEGIRTKIAGEVKVEVQPKHEYRHPEDFREPVVDYSLVAAEEALRNAGIEPSQIPAERWGVVMGTCNAGLLSGVKWYRDKQAGGSPDPSLVCLTPPQALSEAIGGAFGLKGPILSIDTACAAGANAIGYAAQLIRTGQADAILAGGADALSDVLVAGFNSLESLSPKPAAPYSRNREGLSLGEGSGMLVLMREDLAKQLNATILAEIAGYGLSADGYHPTAPHPEGLGASRAIKSALSASGIDPHEVRYVNSHGTGTPKNDPAETNATKRGLGESARTVAVSSTKSMIGHLLGGAGAVEGIVTIKAVEEQIAPPTMNYEERDPECDLDYVPNESRPLAMDVAISNNFAFGGANATIVVVRAGARHQAPPAPNYDRVVITGMAALTNAGESPEDLWQAFVNQRDCTQEEDGVRLGRVNIDVGKFLSPKIRRRMDRLGVFAVIASQLALKDAGIEVTDENRNRIGVMFGTGVGPMESMEKFSRPLFEEGPGAANPAIFPNTVYNAAAGQVAMQVSTVGPTTTVTAGHAAGASSITYGFDLVSQDQADAVVCITGDTLTDTVIAGYRDVGLLSPENGHMALSEGGVALVVERLSKAQARNAKIYGEILGYGIASDAKGVGRFDPRGFGLERAMKVALERAGLQPSDITAVWQSAAGHRLADGGEEAAIRRLFGENVKSFAPKKILGEPMGVGAPVNATLAVQAWQHGDTHGVPRGPVLVNSCSMGGTHFSIVIVPHDE